MYVSCFVGEKDFVSGSMDFEDFGGKVIPFIRDAFIFIVQAMS